MGSGAKSYMSKGFLIYEEMQEYLVIYEEAVSHIPSLLNFLIYEENFIFFFNSVDRSQKPKICLQKFQKFQKFQKYD
jgi:hypothetical protein